MSHDVLDCWGLLIGRRGLLRTSGGHAVMYVGLARSRRVSERSHESGSSYPNRRYVPRLPLLFPSCPLFFLASLFLVSSSFSPEIF